MFKKIFISNFIVAVVIPCILVLILSPFLGLGAGVALISIPFVGSIIAAVISVAYLGFDKIIPGQAFYSVLLKTMMAWAIVPIIIYAFGIMVFGQFLTLLAPFLAVGIQHHMFKIDEEKQITTRPKEQRGKNQKEFKEIFLVSSIITIVLPIISFFFKYAVVFTIPNTRESFISTIPLCMFHIIFPGLIASLVIAFTYTQLGNYIQQKSISISAFKMFFSWFIVGIIWQIFIALPLQNLGLQGAALYGFMPIFFNLGNKEFMLVMSITLLVAPFIILWLWKAIFKNKFQ